MAKTSHQHRLYLSVTTLSRCSAQPQGAWNPVRPFPVAPAATLLQVSRFLTGQHSKEQPPLNSAREEATATWPRGSGPTSTAMDGQTSVHSQPQQRPRCWNADAGPRLLSRDVADTASKEIKT